MSDVETVVRKTLQDMLPGEDDRITLDALLRDLLQDSLDLLEFKMRLEEKLNVELDVGMFESSTTLREFTFRVVNSF
jgi:acyl carrier protein